MIGRRAFLAGGLAAAVAARPSMADVLGALPRSGGDDLAALLSRARPDLRLPAGRTYVTAARLALSPDGLLDLQGSAIVVDRDDGSDATALEVARIRNGSVIVPAGRRVERLLGDVRPAGNPGLWENLRVVQEIDAASPRPLGRDDNDDATIRIRTPGTLIRNVTIEDFDYALRVYADDVTADAVTILREVKGLILDGCSGFRGRTIVSRGKSPNARTEPGNNAIGSGARGSGPLYDTAIGGFDITETGEHGIYFSRAYGSPGSDLVLTDGVIRRTGQCGIKLRYYDRVTVARVVVEDCSWGNRTGTNEDGLRLERCSRVAVSDVVLRSTGREDSAHFGMVLLGSADVSLDRLSLAHAAAGGIFIAPSRIAGAPDYTCTGIVGRNVGIVGCGGPGIVIDHADAPIGPVEITGLRIDGCPGAPVDIRVDRIAEGAKIILQGTFRNCGAGLEAVPRHPQIDLSGLVPG